MPLGSKEVAMAKKKSGLDKVRGSAGETVEVVVGTGKRIVREATARGQKIASAVRKEAAAPTKAAIKELKTAGTFAAKAAGQAKVAAKTAGTAARKANEAARASARKAAQRSGVRDAASNLTRATGDALRRVSPVGGDARGRKPAAKAAAGKTSARKS